MNIYLKSSVIGFLIGVAIYLLLNCVFNIEGIGVKTNSDDSTPVVNITGDDLRQYLIITKVNSISDLPDKEINDSDGISFSYPYTLLQINWDNLMSNNPDLYYSIQHDPVLHVQNFLTYFISTPSKIENIYGDELYIFIDFVDVGKETYLSFMTSLLKLIDARSLKKLKIKAKGINKIFGKLDSIITNTNLPLIREIDLSGINIEGDVPVIVDISNKFTNLEKIYLSGVPIQGDVNHLAEMNSAIKVLDLSGTAVSGDISVLADVSVPSFEELNLSYTAVSGYISVLADVSFPNLRILNLLHTDVIGDISVLADVLAPSLEELNLSWTAVSGNIGVLADVSFPNLKILNLSYTHVSGDISVLADVKFPNLEELDFGKVAQWGTSPSPGDNIIGEINVLGNVKFPNLKALNFESNQAISGDINVFDNFPTLERLDLYNTSVTGDINVIQYSNFPNLRILVLSYTSVSASASDISGFTDQGFTWEYLDISQLDGEDTEVVIIDTEITATPTP